MRKIKYKLLTILCLSSLANSEMIHIEQKSGATDNFLQMISQQYEKELLNAVPTGTDKKLFFQALKQEFLQKKSNTETKLILQAIANLQGIKIPSVLLDTNKKLMWQDNLETIMVKKKMARSNCLL